MFALAPLVEKILLVVLLLPFMLAGWYLYSVNAVIVAEVVPADQPGIPIPQPGDRVLIYGEWVRDEGHIFGSWYNWHELHPVRYLKNFDTSQEGGRMPYSGPLGEGAWNAHWLLPVDPAYPLQNATGIVVETMHNEGDGDVHIHVLPDADAQHLVRFPDSPLRLGVVPLLEFYGLEVSELHLSAVALTVALPLVVWLVYLVLSLRYPKETLLGRLLR